MKCRKKPIVVEAIQYTDDNLLEVMKFCDGGNPVKCDFYPEIREKACRQTQEYRDKKELEFYRWWVTKHNLNVEVATAFERWLNEQKM